MTAPIRVDVEVRLHDFPLRAAFTTGATTLGVFGNSGAGKTTLLETIAGLRRGTAGRIEVGGETWLDSARGIDRPPERRGVGYVPQDDRLFPHWDVLGNILAGRRRARAGSAPIDPDHVIGVLDLAPLRTRRVEALSGGERQRVALARSLCSGPSILLLDEPLGSIESALRSRILHYLLAVRDEFRIPTLYVSHEATEVTILCDEVVVLAEGQVRAHGRPSVIFTAAPREAWSPGAAFENVLEGTITDVSGGHATASIGPGCSMMLATAEGLSAGSLVLVGVGASDLMIAVADTPGLSARNVLPGVIQDLREVDGGALVVVHVCEGQPEMAVMVTHAALKALGLAPGKPVRLVAKAHSCRALATR